MTVRTAKVSDVMAILDLIEEAKARSIYKDDEIDRDFTRQFFTRAMHFNGHSNHQATLFIVSERNGIVEGYFFGFLDRLYNIGKRLSAVDVHFYLSSRADERDALRMLDQFTTWADSNPKVAEIRMGESNVFGDPDPRFAALLKRKGFTKGATIFTKRTTP